MSPIFYVIIHISLYASSLNGFNKIKKFINHAKSLIVNFKYLNPLNNSSSIWGYIYSKFLKDGNIDNSCKTVHP